MADKTTQNTISDKEKRNPKRLSGIVVSNKMKDTVVVAVVRYVKHPTYKKYIKRVKKYKAHDAGNTFNIGDKVRIEETKPISKDKSFRILRSDER
ncbi:30S ribosomal protein S17 [Patescibacteria group bacterium]|nr:30S ribosomal protein S17 [Patescibacteria group bacterium]